MMAEREEEPKSRTEHLEAIDLAEHADQLRRARATGETLPAGRLLGLPELADDVWVDMAGASAITGVPPRTITGWLSRGQPRRLPFPPGHRFLYRVYWPMRVLEDWAAAYNATRNK